MANSCRKGGRGRRWIPLGIVLAGAALTLSVAGTGYCGPYTNSNPVYAGTFKPFCSPCFGGEPIAVSTFRPAYFPPVPACYACLPAAPNYSTQQQQQGNVNVINNVTIVQTVQVVNPDGYGADPWNACRCGPYAVPTAADLGISQVGLR